MMLMTFTEAREKLGSQYYVNRAVDDGRIYRIDTGYYADRPCVSQLELIAKRYPRGILTDDTAYYLHGLTDLVPLNTYLATKRNATRIKNKSIVQVFMKDRLFEPGRSQIKYDGTSVSVYNRERMLVELLRKSSSIPFDYYKELIASYRKIVGELDFCRVEDYIALYERNEHIFNALQREVL